MPQYRKSPPFKAVFFVIVALGQVCGLYAAPAATPSAAQPRGQASHGLDEPALGSQAGALSQSPLPPPPTVAPAASMAVPAVIRPIDAKAVARKFKPGKFKTRMVMIGPDGHPWPESDAMCMNSATADVVVSGVLGGLAGCDVQSSETDKFAIAVTANCPATAQLGANFYTGILHWSANGKQIDMETKRVALEQGQPTNRTLRVIRYKLSYESPMCQ